MYVQTPLGAPLGLGTQPCYEALSDIWVKLVENAVINIGLVTLSPQEWPEVGFGTAKYQLKKPQMLDQILSAIYVALPCYLVPPADLT